MIMENPRIAGSFDEFEYLALFLWLAIAGAGPISLDALLRRFGARRVGSGDY